MRKTTHYARASALPAIAAALALSSTPLLAQEAQPVTEPIPQVTPPPPTMDAVPAPETAPTVDTAATPDEPATATTSKSVKRTTRSTTAKSAARPAPVRTASAQTPARLAPTAPAAIASPAPASESAVTPVVDTTAPTPPAATATAQAAPAQRNNSDVPVLAGGALALLALGGGAFAIARRRREDDDDVWIDEERMSDDQVETVAPLALEPSAEPVHDEQAKIVAPATSAFTWGNTHRIAPVAQEATANGDAAPDDDRMPGESWVDRAYRGPTPNNPSASLRNRLKRAAFFDKREREVAAGTADPVDMDAGLPEAMVDERERELA